MANTKKNAETFWEHLDELRDVLIKIAIATAVCSVVAFFFKTQVFALVLAPKYDSFITYHLINRIGALFAAESVGNFSIPLINTTLANQFVIHMQVSLYVGLLAVSPYILFLLFRFVSPALYENERRYAFPFVCAGYLMFLAGMLLNYFIIFPLTFRFLGSYQVSADVGNLITLQSYVDTLMMMSIVMGIVFEIPILCWLLGKVGVLKSAYMKRYRKHALVVILVVAAIITPTSDIFTLLLVAGPIWLLYEVSIFIVTKIERKKLKSSEQIIEIENN